jgi:hypothetical protein
MLILLQQVTEGQLVKISVSLALYELGKCAYQSGHGRYIDGRNKRLVSALIDLLPMGNLRLIFSSNAASGSILELSSRNLRARDSPTCRDKRYKAIPGHKLEPCIAHCIEKSPVARRRSATNNSSKPMAEQARSARTTVGEPKRSMRRKARSHLVTN